MYLSPHMRPNPLLQLTHSLTLTNIRHQTCTFPKGNVLAIFHVIWNWGCVFAIRFLLYHQAYVELVIGWLHIVRYIFILELREKYKLLKKGGRKTINKCINIGKLPMSCSSTGVINKMVYPQKWMTSSLLVELALPYCIERQYYIHNGIWNGLISIKWQCSRESAMLQPKDVYTSFSKNASRIFLFHNYALLLRQELERDGNNTDKNLQKGVRGVF